MTPMCPPHLLGSGPMSAEDQESWGQSYLSAGLAPAHTSLSWPPSPDSLSLCWVFGWRITDASLSLVQKRTHFAHRSPLGMVCPGCVSSADLIGDGPPSTSRWQKSYFAGPHCPEGSFKCPLPSPHLFSLHPQSLRKGRD